MRKFGRVKAWRGATHFGTGGRISVMRTYRVDYSVT